MFNSAYSETIIITTPTASGGGPAASTQWRQPVGTFTDLSTVAVPSLTPPPVPGEMRVVLDVDRAYLYDDSSDSWLPVDTVNPPQNTWGTISGDTGSIIPVSPNSPLALNGGLGIDTNASGSSVTLALNAVLNDLNDVDTTIVTANDGLLFDGANFVPTRIPFVVGFGRNQNASNIWLRTYNGTPSNQSPVVIAPNSKLIAITAATNAVETWTAEVYSGATVRTGGTPAGPPDASLNITGANSGVVSALNVDYATGTEIGVFCRGTGISKPTVRLWFVQRVV